jgi:hypothetical protein
MSDAPRAASISELMDLDEAGAVGEGAYGFDDQLWLLLTARIATPDQAASLPEQAWVYLASRWMEWEVGNGGFPQAAYNIPDWFELGEAAYRKLGLDAAAGLIARARTLIAKGETRGGSFAALDIGNLFAQFRESELAKLDDELDAVDWWADEVRLAYVRQNRAAFRELEAGRPATH